MTDTEWQEAVAIVAGWPRSAALLRAVHVAGPDGRCRGCASSARLAPRWPCRLALLAGSDRLHPS